jgi:hypothetical protein
MPRRKRGGSRGPSPDKSFSEGGGAMGPTSFNNGGQTTPPWSTTTDDTPQQQSREEMFHNLQEMFSGKVEGNVVHMILEECDWKGKPLNTLPFHLHCMSHFPYADMNDRKMLL